MNEAIAASDKTRLDRIKDRLSNNVLVVFLVLSALVMIEGGNLVSSVLDARKLAHTFFQREVAAQYDSNFVATSLAVLSDVELWLSTVEYRTNPSVTDSDLTTLAGIEAKTRMLKVIAEASNISKKENGLGETKVVAALGDITKDIRMVIKASIDTPNKTICPVPPGTSCIPPSMVEFLRGPLEETLTNALRLQYQLRSKANAGNED